MTPADPLTALQALDPQVRAQAADAIGPDDLAAVPVLAVAAEDSEGGVAAAARGALARLAPAALRAAMASATNPLRTRLDDLLAALRGDARPLPDPFPVPVGCPDTLFPVVLALTHSDSDGVRVRAVELLGAFTGARVLPVFLTLFAHPDPHTRRVTADVLARSPSRSPRVLPALARLLKDPCPEVRAAAGRAVLKAEPTAQTFPGRELARSTFARLVTDPDPAVRGHALRVAARFRDEWVADVARIAVADPAPGLRVQAVRILEARPSPDTRASLRGLLCDPAEEVRLAVIGVYSRYPAEDLAVCLDDSAPAVRRCALAAAGDKLLDLDPTRAERLLTDPAPVVRVELARALGKAPGRVPPAGAGPAAGRRRGSGPRCRVRQPLGHRYARGTPLVVAGQR